MLDTMVKITPMSLKQLTNSVLFLILMLCLLSSSVIQHATGATHLGFFVSYICFHVRKPEEKKIKPSHFIISLGTEQ